MSKILISQELNPENIFKWIGIVKTIFTIYQRITISGLAPRFPMERIHREMGIYFYTHKILKALCEFSIEENNIEVSIKDYCSWYIFQNSEDNFFHDSRKIDGR
jgi:hypothetical protein